nr:UDP-sugar pyrophosphorylase [Ipomoea trifida]
MPNNAYHSLPYSSFVEIHHIGKNEQQQMQDLPQVKAGGFDNKGWVIETVDYNDSSMVEEVRIRGHVQEQTASERKHGFGRSVLPQASLSSLRRKRNLQEVCCEQVALPFGDVGSGRVWPDVPPGTVQVQNGSAQDETEESVKQQKEGLPVDALKMDAAQQFDLVE